MGGAGVQPLEHTFLALLLLACATAHCGPEPYCFCQSPEKVLSLRSNALQVLGADAFCCNHLRSLDISDNELSSVDSNAFQGARNLEELNLSENDIASLPRNVFVNNTMLFELKLARNRISRLEFLWDIPSLRFLQLSHNALESLPGSVFWGVPGLYHISLARNRLTCVSQTSFRGLQSLADLDLSHNALTSLAAGVFEGTPMLQRLNVEGNQLTQLRFLSWPSAPALTHLLAAGNAFTSLDPCDRNSEYAPVTSCDVERSFSGYKTILSDTRRGFLFNNLKMDVVIN